MTKIGTTEWDVLTELYDLEHDAWTANDLPFYLAELASIHPSLNWHVVQDG